mmetsp:Transcript_30143/g.70401  ORF Transcript_30143/g.70401 Transcript_30143/m.70401 type:complete len:328 (-) Transcript_30143:302-1285(-)
MREDALALELAVTVLDKVFAHPSLVVARRPLAPRLPRLGGSGARSTRPLRREGEHGSVRAPELRLPVGKVALVAKAAGSRHPVVTQARLDEGNLGACGTRRRLVGGGGGRRGGAVGRRLVRGRRGGVGVAIGGGRGEEEGGGGVDQSVLLRLLVFILLLLPFKRLLERRGVRHEGGDAVLALGVVLVLERRERAVRVALAAAAALVRPRYATLRRRVLAGGLNVLGLDLAAEKLEDGVRDGARRELGGGRNAEGLEKLGDLGLGGVGGHVGQLLRLLLRHSVERGQPAVDGTELARWGEVELQSQLELEEEGANKVLALPQLHGLGD